MAQKQMRLTPEALLQFPILSDAQISPDGRSIAYVSGEIVTDNTKLAKRHIWIVDPIGKNARQFSNGPRADFHPRWSPDGKRIAFLSDREEDGKVQIFLMDTSGGEAISLLHGDGTIDASRRKDAFQWSPDGKSIAVLITDPETDEEKRKKETKDDPQEFEKSHKFTRLWTLSVSSGERAQVTRSDVQVWEFQWTPDGKEFALIISEYPYEWSWYRSKLARCNASGGKPSVFYSPKKRQIALPRWSPDQKQIAFLSSVWSDRGCIQGNVFVMSSKGGEPRDVTGDYEGCIGWMEWIKNGAALLTCGYEKGQAAFSELDLKRGHVKSLWRERLAITEHFWPTFSFAKKSQKVGAIRSAPKEARNAWTGSIAAGHMKWNRVTDAVPDLRKFSLGEQEMINWQSCDGLLIHGILIKPVGYKRGKRYPLITNPHGGPSSVTPNAFLGAVTWGQLLAARGYAVFLPNFRGSTGFGLRFTESNVGDMGGMDFHDVETGVDALIERGIADPNRLGYGGWSYGGFMTCWTITQTNRYKAAVMGAGVSNWLSFHGNSHLHTWDANHYDADPYEQDGPYHRFSAMHFVKRVKTPTLILHGELDRDVPPEQSYQFYRALRDHGIHAELVIYPREGHGISEKNHWLDLHRRIGDWYDRYL